MKGVIPAAGLGTRLWPITKIVNKTLLPVYDKPVIYYVIDTMVSSGIEDIMVVIPTTHVDQFEKLLEDGKKLGVKSLKIKACDHTLGMPYSIRQAKTWAGKEPIMVIPGDNVFFQYFADEVSKFRDGALVFIRKVKDPSRFGVPLYKNKKITGFTEKPKKPKTNYAVVAPYIFDSNVYKYIDELKPSERGELEIIDLLSRYLNEYKLKILKKQGFWKDVGTPDSFIDAGNYIRNRLRLSSSRKRK